MRIIKLQYSNHEIFIGDEDCKIRIWSLGEGEPLCKTFLTLNIYEAHKGPITQYNMDQGTKVLISTEKDKTMKVNFI